MDKPPASVPTPRKIAAMSTPALVAARRTLYFSVTKHKLLGGVTSSQEDILKKMDAELTRRNITIHHPELP